MATVDQMRKLMLDRLGPKYGAGEAKSMISLIFHALKGWNPTQLIINGNLQVSSYLTEKIDDILRRLDKDEPIQYILGEARFYGLDLLVTPDVLIPRHETEELVDLIVKENERKDLDVLDICTGSGAIAVALSRYLPFSHVTALDISAGALEIAHKNADKLHADINFIKEDVFLYLPNPESFDIIVSNPPYIARQEEKEMDANVLLYEPHMALFVPDENPLIFYSRIAEIANIGLKKDGRIYLEINPLYADSMLALYKDSGFRDVRLIKDISHRQRFLTACK